MSAHRLLLILFAALIALAPACKDEEASEEAAAEEEAPKDGPSDNNAPPTTARDKRFKPGDNNNPVTPQPRAVDLGKAKGTKTTAEGTDEPDTAVPTRTTRKVRRNTDANALPVDKYFKKEDIRAAVDSFDGLLKLDAFPGQSPSKTYNSMRWSTDNEKRFGFGIQVWRPGSPQAATKRYNGLFEQSVGGKAITAAGTPTFTTEHHDLRTVTFVSNGAVAAVTCDQALCDADQLLALAARIQQQLR